VIIVFLVTSSLKLLPIVAAVFAVKYILLRGICFGGFAKRTSSHTQSEKPKTFASILCGFEMRHIILMKQYELLMS
jgi:hypothetical protein